MYHCHIHFYLIGLKNRAFEMIKEMHPLENFTHEFSESEQFEEKMAVKADVIFAFLQDVDVKEALQTIGAGKKQEAELILLADKEQMQLMSGLLSEVKDIWTLPMTDEEISFRILRWQQACKSQKDSWQTSQYLEAVINNTPNMVWYKGKDGIHEKVNEIGRAHV